MHTAKLTTQQAASLGGVAISLPGLAPEPAGHIWLWLPVWLMSVSEHVATLSLQQLQARHGKSHINVGNMVHRCPSVGVWTIVWCMLQCNAETGQLALIAETGCCILAALCKQVVKAKAVCCVHTHSSLLGGPSFALLASNVELRGHHTRCWPGLNGS